MVAVATEFALGFIPPFRVCVGGGNLEEAGCDGSGGGGGSVHSTDYLTHLVSVGRVHDRKLWVGARGEIGGRRGGIPGVSLIFDGIDGVVRSRRPRRGREGGWVGFSHVAEIFVLFLGYCNRVSERAIPYSEGLNSSVGVLFGDAFEKLRTVFNGAAVREVEVV